VGANAIARDTTPQNEVLLEKYGQNATKLVEGVSSS